MDTPLQKTTNSNIHILYMCVHTIHPLPHTYSHSSVRNAALQSRHAKVYLGLLYNLRYRLIHSLFPEYHSAPCHFLAACSFLPLSFSLFIPTLPLSTAHLSYMTTFKAFCFHVDTWRTAAYIDYFLFKFVLLYILLFYIFPYIPVCFIYVDNAISTTTKL